MFPRREITAAVIPASILQQVDRTRSGSHQRSANCGNYIVIHAGCLNFLQFTRWIYFLLSSSTVWQSSFPSAYRKPFLFLSWTSSVQTIPLAIKQLKYYRIDKCNCEYLSPKWAFIFKNVIFNFKSQFVIYYNCLREHTPKCSDLENTHHHIHAAEATVNH